MRIRILVFTNRMTILLFSTFFLFSCGAMEIPTPIPEFLSIDEAPAWSPDGKWIAYLHFNRDVNDTVYPTGLYIIDTNGINRNMLIATNLGLPDWSPNGEKVAFTNGNISTIDINTRDVNQLTDNGSDFFPSWFPDGSKISFDRSGTPDSVGTWIIDLTTSSQNRLGFFSQLDWGPSGEKIIFSGSSNKDSESQIWLADSDGSNEEQLTTNNFRYNRYPKWCPVNNKIGWEVLRNNTYSSEIWLMNCEGSNQMKLTEGKTPSWSPDGARIVYSKPVNDKIILFVINIKTKETKQLTF